MRPLLVLAEELGRELAEELGRAVLALALVLPLVPGVGRTLLLDEGRALLLEEGRAVPELMVGLPVLPPWVLPDTLAPPLFLGVLGCVLAR